MLIHKVRLAVWNIPELCPQQEQALEYTCRPNCVYSHLFLEFGFSDTTSDSSIYVTPQSSWATNLSTLPQSMCLFGGWKHSEFAGYKIYDLGTQHHSTSEAPNALPNHVSTSSHIASNGIYGSTATENCAGEATVFAESTLASWFRIWLFDSQYSTGAIGAIAHCGLGASQSAWVSSFCSATGRACLITSDYTDEFTNKQKLYIVDYLSRWD